MKKLDLSKAADKFDTISSDVRLYYNKETGEFGFYNEFEDTGYDDYADDDDADSDAYDGDDDDDRFGDECWVAAPDQYEINEYGMMTAFAESAEDPRAKELLSVALQGKGAFRRFRDTLSRVDLTEEWYAFRHDAYIAVARKWCRYNDIPYDEP